MDFAPTVLELAGLETDAIAGEGDGVSLAPARSVAARARAPRARSSPSTTPRACRRRRRWSAPGATSSSSRSRTPTCSTTSTPIPLELTDVSRSADGAATVSRVARRSSSAGWTSTTSTPGAGEPARALARLPGAAPGPAHALGPPPALRRRDAHTSATARTSTSSSAAPGWTAARPTEGGGAAAALLRWPSFCDQWGRVLKVGEVGERPKAGPARGARVRGLRHRCPRRRGGDAHDQPRRRRLGRHHVKSGRHRLRGRSRRRRTRDVQLHL